MASNPFAFLKTTNDWLESVPKRARKALNNAVGNGEKIAQSKVDEVCIWLSWKINVQIERVRQSLIRTLYGMIQSTAAGRVMKMATAIKEFVSDPLGALGTFASAIFSPVSAVFSWTSTLVKEVPRLAENLANIASVLPPEPPNSRINYDKFKIKVKSFSWSTLTSDPSKLPPPEVVFPPPSSIQSPKITFDKAMEEDSKLKSNKMKYKLTKEQENSLKLMQLNSSEVDSLSFNESTDADSLSFG